MSKAFGSIKRGLLQAIEHDEGHALWPDMMALAEVIRERGMTEGEAAALFGVTQPRVSDLVRGKINLFSLDTLIDVAATAGMAPMVKVSKPKAPDLKPALRRKRRAAVELVTA